MIDKDNLEGEIRKEQKFTRQFFMSMFMILVVIFNVGLYIVKGFTECGAEFSSAYLIQACFIPAFLLIMAYYFYRLHRKNINSLKQQLENQSKG